MPASAQLGVPQALTPAARKARAGYLRKLDAYHRAARRAVALNILVWGPAPDSENPVPRKRKDIRAALIEAGHNAMFSEELTAEFGGLPETAKEFPQALFADLVIVLMEGAPGAIAEVSVFGLSGMGSKFCVMAPKSYQSGFVALGPLRELAEAHGGSLFWYEPADLAVCHVLTEALKRAETLRHKRYREITLRKLNTP